VEVELKLAIDPADVGRLRDAPPLARARPAVVRMDGVYLDTDDCEVARHGMALRLRRAGRRWMQCLKAGRSGTGGMHARDEWEYEQPRAEVDLALFRETPLAALPSASTLHERLRPAFRVTFDRTLWNVAPAKGSRLEVALDRGAVVSGARSDPLCEVEIECVEGGAVHAFDLAEALAESATLRPSMVTKARRGYRLFRGEKLRPVRAVPAAVHRDMTPAAAARAIVAAALEQLQANEEGLLASDDPEFVHQARVAMRRVRSALRMFRNPIGKERAQAWRKELGPVARTLGVARDWDVFVEETLAALPADAAVIERARRQRFRARDKAREAIRSRRYAFAILHLARWLAIDDDGPEERPLDDFAARLLARRHRRLVDGLDQLEGASVDERHRIRIAAKRLRYVVEGLAPALDQRAARRYAHRLAGLQDALGQANDAVTGRRLLAALHPPDSLADFAAGWFDSRIDDQSPPLARVAKQLTRTKPFWRDPEDG
jgi:triphosphatase